MKEVVGQKKPNYTPGGKKSHHGQTVRFARRKYRHKVNDQLRLIAEGLIDLDADLDVSPISYHFTD